MNLCRYTGSFTKGLLRITMERKLPIGIQGFEKLRTDHFLYVDKTEYVYHLVHNNVPYFLSRPRRFGKSLLLSTMKAYWEGKKELFHGLRIASLEEGNPAAWQAYPVFYFDFNGVNYQARLALEGILDEQLRRWEKEYGIAYSSGSLGERFRNLILTAKEQTGLRAVILVDEYDKPLLDVIDNEELQQHNREVCKGFFSTLKSFDEHIQFIFITGVTKFHKVSIFSDLNQLRDISLNRACSGICGITKQELTRYFEGELMSLADAQGLSREECLEQLKRTYDGYYFHPDGSSVYNPYSLLCAFADEDFGSYWYETGTPTFLVRKLKNASFTVRKLTDHTLYASEAVLRDYTEDNSDPIPLLYQTGYLTIVGYDRNGREYTLSFPNEEVKYGFLESLMPAYVSDCGSGSGKDIFTLKRYVEHGETDKIRDVLTALFAGITYTLASDPFEHYFQTVIYLVFTLLDKFVLCEMHTFNGRIDCKVETKNYIYLFEFKRDDSAEAALAQIDSKEYALPFISDSRKLFKIGVTFDSSTRKLAGWKVSE